MCDLDGAKTSLEALLDEVRDLKAERDRLRIRLKAIYGIGHNNDCLLCGFKDKFALQALAGKENDNGKYVADR